MSRRFPRRPSLLHSLWLFTLALLLWGCPTAEDGDPPADPATAEGSGSELAGADDTVDFSFVFFGCNRLGYDDPIPPSTANIPQLTQTVADIANLETAPRYLFMLGDLVRNEVEDDGSTLEQQLTDWQTLWDGLKSQLPDTQLVPVPGNHEVLYSTKVHIPEGCDCDDPGCTCRYDEFPNTDAYDKWLDWMSQNSYDGLAGNGPTPATDPADRLVLDDSNKLTYSFQSDLQSGQKVHFTLVDTDALSTYRATDPACIQDQQNADKAVPGWMAANWVQKDIGAAQADADVGLIFAMGHKPAQAHDGSRDPKGRDTVINCSDATLADQFVSTLSTHDKVAGYLTSHDHNWWHATVDDTASQSSVEQIVAGNAGSPPDPTAPYFGFTLVEIYTSGKVIATSYGRTIPNPIDDPDNVEPATALTTVTLR